MLLPSVCLLCNESIIRHNYVASATIFTSKHKYALTDIASFAIIYCKNNHLNGTPANQIHKTIGQRLISKWESVILQGVQMKGIDKKLLFWPVHCFNSQF